MMKIRVSRTYVGPLCGDCIEFAYCKGRFGVEVRDRPCEQFIGLGGQ